ncbi:unnamed protein product, partial [Musa banksii]
GTFLLVRVHDDKPGRSSALSNLLKQQRKKHNVFLTWFRNTKGYTRLETRKCSQRYGNHTLLSQPRAKRGLTSWEARKGQKVGAVRERIDPWDSRWFKRRQHIVDASMCLPCNDR